MSAMLAALRLKLPPHMTWYLMLYEAFFSSALSVLLNGILLALILPAIGENSLVFVGISLLLLVVASMMTVVFFFFVRVAILLWRKLERLRRKHLRWALTHALLIVAMFLMLPMLAMGAADWQGPTELSDTIVLQTLSFLSSFVFMLIPIGAVLLVVFLPTAIFSYFVVLRTTRGLEALLSATEALREGQYEARVVVEGEDEVAQLQHNFNAMAADLERVMAELRDEREKSERLLLNVLPSSIAERLKQEPSTIADSFDEATVLFADIVDFTDFSAHVSPTELVELLNQIFSAFDRLAEEHGLEKIKTIGDAYMVVGGLPQPRPDHVHAVAAMAIAMQREISRFNTEGGKPFTIRIGINTGPVIAGVIGIKRFIYDLWGDTVNLASRMESHGVVGRIQVTEAAYERLKDHFFFEARGLIHIKGKGQMSTYLLKGEKDITERHQVGP
ncbi:MAG: HAMP domain-containing protein [Ardenticatenales bacterium]|nr:HAMP domain-containing protein [Ardenticatenales bacterium]